MTPQLRPEVSILIPSIGRESLRRTILGAQHAAQRLGRTFEIIVIDDSVDGAAASLCAQLESSVATLRTATSASRNIAIARNLSLANALGDWLVFIDDDEWPEEDWLERHFATLELTGADAVIGPVRAHYPDNAPGWVVRGDPYSRWHIATGTTMKQGSTANAVIRHAALTQHRLHFQNHLGRSGGEDADLFSRLHRCGARIVASDGLVHEEIGIDRCSLRDLTRRAIRVGQTYAGNHTAHYSRLRRLRFCAAALAKGSFFAAAALAALPLGMRRAMPMMQRSFRNFGKIAFLAGYAPIHYYRHGNEALAIGEQG